MTFTADYPNYPPRVAFKKIGGKPLFHPNVYEDGGVCLDLINPPGSTHGYGEGGTWTAALSIKAVLLALQTFLDEPNVRSPAQQEAYLAYRDNKPRYEQRVKQQVAQVEQLSS